ncbi:MAG: DNA polymerase I [Sphingobacteriales bacterium]|nr:MAG: DNA polymerase I [Sphingobacteriales bacterium]
MNDKKLFLLDAMALIYRAYFSLVRSPRITSAGRNTNAQFGFTNTLVELLNKEKPTHLAVVFEGGKSDTDVHRTNLFADYKANRAEQPEDIKSALPDIKAIIEGFNLPCLSSKGYEADDVIGTIAKKAAAQGYEVYMVTPDKDMGQLVGDGIYMYKPGYMGSSHEILDSAAICAKWNIQNVHQVIDILGLMGDAVDNIPGIAGVGEKTAAKLLSEYGSVEGVIENADKIKGALGEKVRAGIESAIMSKQLATIMTDAPVDFDEAACEVGDWNRDALAKMFDQLEFKAMGRRILGDDFAPPVAITQGALDLFGNPLPAHLQPAASGTGEDTEGSAPVVDKNITNTPHTYHLVQTDAEIDTLVAALSGKLTISFDTETTSIDANLAELVGMSFCWQQGEAWYVALPEAREDVLRILAKFQFLFDDAQITWVGQNLKYDWLVLKWYGIEPKGPVWDTMLAHYLLEPEGKRNMDVLAGKYLGYEPVSILSLIGKKGKDQLTMRQVDVNLVKEYAGEDADVVWQLKDVFEPALKADRMETLFHDVEAPLVPVLADMEYEGVGIDVPFLEEYGKVLSGDIVAAEEQVFAEAGLRFNIGSPKQLGEVLFDVMKIEGGGRKTKTGQYATGEDVLARLRGKHPIIDAITTYRELTKLKATYVDALPQLIHPKTGRIHTSFNQTVASTGRLSSSNPNLQNIPVRTDRGREIRKAFIPRGEGWTLVSADYSQIELRIIAAIAKEATMMEAFATGRDVHTATAAKVFGVPESEVTGDMRRVAKTTNFGIIYGQSAFGLAEKLGIPRKEASEVIKAYFEQYPAIQTYIEERTEFARKHLYAETLDGRRRWLRDIRSSNPTVRSFAERNAINMPIQGTAADMIKKAMIAVHQELSKRPLESRMVLQVHDELIFDVPYPELEEVRDLIEGCMEKAMVLPNGVAIKAETGYGKNWLEAH